MNRRAEVITFCLGVLALGVGTFGPARAADAAQAQPVAAQQGSSPPAATAGPELDELLVEGNRVKPTRDPQKIVNWLKLLVGKFRYGGYVQLHGEGVSSRLLPAQGSADCTAFGRAPGVHCQVNVAWPEVHGPEGQDVPGGVSTLAPAMVEYGLDTDHLGIRFLQVDNQGLANFGQGYLVGDTLITTTPCPDVTGNCQRTTRITAHADGKLIEMQIEIVQDYERRVRYRFLLQRVGEVPAGAISGASE